MTKTIEPLEAMARAICAADSDIRMGDAEGVVQQRVDANWKGYIHFARAALASISLGVAAEPQAWLYEIPGSGVWRLYRTRYVSPQAVAEGWTETPLYAANTLRAFAGDRP